MEGLKADSTVGTIENGQEKQSSKGEIEIESSFTENESFKGLERKDDVEHAGPITVRAAENNPIKTNPYKQKKIIVFED